MQRRSRLKTHRLIVSLLSILFLRGRAQTQASIVTAPPSEQVHERYLMTARSLVPSLPVNSITLGFSRELPPINRVKARSLACGMRKQRPSSHTRTSILSLKMQYLSHRFDVLENPHDRRP
jgi:hypothetical protein